LSSYLRYNYTEATDKTALSTRGRQLPLRPRSRAVLGLNFIDRAGTKILAELNWQSRMFIDPIWSNREGFSRFTGAPEGFDPRAPRPRFPSKLTLNLRFGKEPTVRQEWSVDITNLFN